MCDKNGKKYAYNVILTQQLMDTYFKNNVLHVRGVFCKID